MIPRPMAAVLDNEELVQIGAALSKLRVHEGWDQYLALLEKFKRDTERRGLRDKSKTREYYEGYADAIDEIVAAVDYLIEEGATSAAVLRDTDASFAMPRISAAVSGT